ncbi:GntR family transcriptional regulator [Sphingosinicella sp. CPCC 101087]|uniref:GntR family transcriptional regulator n=1 Tax=Sphingosinicella sp. CPCC 101087 TaxID=2497754 RepID=UPI0013E9BC35|nr:GntR family transcriptional regulator [Sphingosinicella sp. CPCC 101087]
MNPGPTFERVYLAVKEQLVSGRFAPGQHLEPAALGDELLSSITPVRDALHRLVGERLAEAPGHNGFRAPLLTESALRHLYRWSADLALVALRSLRRSRPPADLPLIADPCGPAPDQLPRAASNLFAGLAQLAGSPELEVATINANERLFAARKAEPDVLDDVADELGALTRQLRRSDLPAARRGVARYCRRRCKAVPRILEAMRS